jgi:putative FmdB family regulatory protein
MPIYEYRCRSCDRPFEALVTAARTPACPGCGSADLEKQHSVFAVTARSSEPHAPMSPCGTCGDPRGAGACSLN